MLMSLFVSTKKKSNEADEGAEDTVMMMISFLGWFSSRIYKAFADISDDNAKNAKFDMRTDNRPNCSGLHSDFGGAGEEIK